MRQLRRHGYDTISISNFADRHNAMWFMRGWTEYHTPNLKGGYETAEEVNEPVMRWLADNLDRELSLDDIAARAGMSTRSLNRHFREQTGSSPLQWLHRTRIRQAQHLLEATSHPVERIAVQVGYGSPTAFRERFKRVVGTSPQAYRGSFRGAA